MSAEFLEIHRFTGDGGKERTIRCLPGRVSVFRARTDSELAIYRQAIEGTVVGERFSLMLDSQTFIPKDHFFIGFGARDESPTGQLVGDYLSQWGVSASNQEPALFKMGLGGLLSVPCRDLQPREWRALRQLACLVGISARQVFFLHDPFFEFSETDRETFAAAWARFAWEQKKIVIVTKLSDRPESWIENDFIARIQLERPRQATIGFGGSSDASAGSSEPFNLKKMRAALQGNSNNTELAGLTDVSKFYFLKQYARSPIYVAGALCFLALFFGASLVVYHVVTDDTELVAVNTAAATKTDSETMSSKNGSSSNNSYGQTAVNSKDGLNISVSQAPLINAVPEELEIAWTTALDHPLSLLISNPSASSNGADNDQPNNEQKSEKTQDFARFYEFLAH